MRKVLATWEAHCAYSNLPRILLPKLRKAGFELSNAVAFNQFALDYDPDNYSVQTIPFIQRFVSGKNGLTEKDATAWAENSKSIGERGEHFYCLNQFMYILTKPRK